MKNVAVIDCGSNSFRLLIASISDFTMEELYRSHIMVRLGESLTKDQGKIEQTTKTRAINALREFSMRISEHNCSDYFCLGTSALRTAYKAKEFIEEAYMKTGLLIEIISEEDEALYSYLGAKQNDDDHSSAVLDIGGGSTEIIYYHQEKLRSASVLLGAARLKSSFWPEKLTPTKEEIKDAREYIHSVWCKQNIASSAITAAVGVAGTITTLASIEKQLEVYSANEINNTILTYNMINNVLSYIMQLDEEDRFLLKGMIPPQRANNIIAGILILLETMKYFKLDKIKVRSTCLLEGVIIRKFLKNSIDNNISL